MNALPDSNALWESWNVALFQHLHATSSSPHALIAVATVLAEWPLFVGAGVTGWQLLRQRDRLGMVRLIAAGGMALLIEALVSALAFHPRPFAVGFGPAWVTHTANNSMPSTHVTLTLIMAITLAMRRQRWTSLVVVVLATMLAWARVYVGIHWPADMVGAALSAIVSVAVIYGLEWGITVLMQRRKENAVARLRQEPELPVNTKRSPARQPTER
ncbi:hypothetical protein RHOFW510R12_35160 [Rhodanobacter sp. FW510-R12]|uniref:phosphatase PAP2 family protein n=1 Tax=Rhodanobacter TaxID=75309 RepID=UPI00040A3E1C|nr:MULTISPECIES: phosphatase PAP2 family protein [Rhodanobacter]UJJ49428.1 phosphatase PAP2 family protein [Rhodanobacter denitrificans]UJJ53511.1 phosphatase PAP2 family protein [Rhodanobacter thiooxydans]